MTQRFVLIANPENRRVEMFRAALAAQRLPPPTVLPHEDLLRDLAPLRALDPGPAIVRLESCGENAAVDHALLARGHGAARARGCSTVDVTAYAPVFGEVLCPRQRHLGYLDYLEDLARVFAERPAWRVWSPPAAVAVLFDKRATSARYAAAEIPVPEVGAADSPEDLRRLLAERGWKSVVVKLSCGSSASGLAVYNGRVVMTTMRRDQGRWRNSLRVQRVSGPAADAVLAYLLAEGAQIERYIPKARFARAFFDCRVLVVAGEPAFCVVRQSHHPITNLHLGGWRGDLDQLRAAVPDDAWAAAMESCRRVWALHGCHHLGIDLMFEPGLARHRVIEANAFGDLLPGLERDGYDVYGWEIAHR